MRGRIMPGLLAVALAWLMTMGQAQAVSLGKIEVTSHLGETFYAEVPLQLESGEKITSIFVELGNPADYRVLEIYRDPALNAIRADVKKDSRGARVELSSLSIIEAPFFNLVLKLRHGRATHFKRYPVFLDLPIAKVSKARPLPKVSAVKPAGEAKPTPEARPEPARPEARPAEPETVKPGFKAYNGWARIDRYGPMVYGDTITTVAHRLRVDERYTMQQVMVALFVKNRSKFDQDNINLIKAGTYLDVPTSTEVEAITPQDARKLIGEHERRWSQLKKQPRYAAIAEAQKNRYSKRVRMGKAATGAAPGPIKGKKEGPAAPTPEKEKATPGQPVAKAPKAAPAPNPEQQKEIEALRTQNEELKGRLKKAEDRVGELESRSGDADLAAANAKINRLEMQIANLRKELDEAKEKRVQTGVENGMMQWLTYGLGGAVILLLIVIAYLMRRERPHPVEMAAAAMPEPAEAAPQPEPVAGLVEKLPEEAEAPEMPEEEPQFEEEEPQFEEEGPPSTAEHVTVKMSSEEIEQSFEDSIPELTEHDTAEMEAFQEEEEEPDPNVDYLAESDVYMRYGMEDEAMQHIRMAIRQREDNEEAHSRLVKLLYSQGDKEAQDEAIAAATGVLTGDALDRFNATVEKLGSEEVAAGELEDTIPPTVIPEEVPIEETVKEEETGLLEEEIDLSGLELPEEMAEEETPAEAAPQDFEMPEEVPAEAELEVPELEPPEVEAPEVEVEAAPIEEVEPAEPVSDETLDLGELEWPAEEESAEAEETVIEETIVESPEDLLREASGEQEVVQEEEAAPEKAEVAEEEAKAEADLEFSLSDMEMPEVESGATAEKTETPVETADLEATIAMDWSKDTALQEEEEQPAVEVKTGELEFEESEAAVEKTAEPEPAAPEVEAPEREEAATEEKQVEAEPEAPAEEEAAEEVSAPVDIGEEDLDTGRIEVAITSKPMDDFTSTVRLTVDDMKIKGGEEEKEDDFTSTIDGMEAFDAEAAKEEMESKASSEEAKKAPEEADSAIDLEVPNGEFDVSKELDALLSESEGDIPKADVSPTSLPIDAGRSQLAQGNLDEAEQSFNSALESEAKCQALIGLAEVAQQRGDADKATDLLAQAEPLLDEQSRDWYEKLKG